MTEAELEPTVAEAEMTVEFGGVDSKLDRVEILGEVVEAAGIITTGRP